MRIHALFFIVLLFCASVSAEFTAFGPQTLELQPCSFDLRNVTIQNTGTETADYSLSVDGDGADFVTFGALSFALQPTQAVNIPVFYTIPCTTEPDAYPLSIFFSDGETELQLDQDIVVALTETLNVSTTATSLVSSPCQKSVFNFSLHNPSNFTELYNIYANGRDDLALSEEQTVLTSGQRKLITLTIEPEDCTEYGTYPLEVVFESEKSNHAQTFNLEYISTPTDIPELAPEVTRIKTDYADSTTDLSIKNIGDRTTTYTLSVDGIDWGSIVPAKITLLPGELRKVTLRLVPLPGTPSGQYLVTFNALVDQTQISYDKNFVIMLAEPSLAEENPGLFAGIAAIIIFLLLFFVFFVKALESEKFKRQYVAWKQRREKARTQSFEAREKRRQARLDWRKQEAEKQKKLKEQAKQQVEREIKREYKLVSHKEILRGAPIKSKKSRAFLWIIFLALLAIVAIALWDYLAPNLPFVIAGIIIVAILIILTWIKRTRMASRRYKLLLPEQTVNLPVWKRGLSQLTISPEQATRNFIVRAHKTKTRVKPSPFVYQTFQLQENAKAETVATFTIPKSLLIRNGVELESLRIARYTNHSWKTISYEKTGEDRNCVFLRAELTPGTHTIFLKNVKQQRSTWPSWVLGIAGLALLGLVVVSLYTPAVSGVIPPQSWKKDTTHQLELSPFFKDPDNDTLVFSATSISNMAIDIVGTKATMTPRPGWTGKEQVRFIADDRRGGKTSSNLVTLTVREQVVPPPLRSGILIVLGILAVGLIVQAFRRLKSHLLNLLF